LSKEFFIREVRVEDIPDIILLRRMMFQSMGYNNPDELEAHDRSVTQYFSKTILSGDFRGWVAVAPNGKVVGTGGVVIDQHPPSPANLTGKIGYIMNIGTLPEYRGKGIAHNIMKVIINWIKEQGIQVADLHASDMGRKLYADLGFQENHGMRLKIK
jgi:GNAT superfamily N-acetyltransferase